MAYTAGTDVVIPRIFTGYLQALTEVKSRFIESGAVVRDPMLDALLQGGGRTFDIPSWKDLADTAANVSLSATGSAATPLAMTSFQEIGVRLSRNQVWGAMDMAGILAGDDPMQRIAQLTAPYWTRQLQDAVIATLAGVFADNAANDSGDYTHDITDTYEAGVTDFSAEAFIDAVHTMGDSEGDLGIVIMHHVVYAKAKKNNLIDFVSDSANPLAAAIPTFLGRRVLVDDRCPVATQDYTTYILGAGAIKWGVGTPKTPMETYRLPLDGAGGGSEALITRVEWLIHPAGHAYIGTSPDGGPTNAGSANNLAAAGSWDRRTTERKQAKLASLVTTEA